MRLTRREIIGIVVVLCIGSSSMLVSIIRWVVVKYIITAREYTWHAAHVMAVLSHAESVFGILAFSLPAYRSFLRQFFSSRRSGDEAMEIGRGDVPRVPSMDSYSSLRYNPPASPVRGDLVSVVQQPIIYYNPSNSPPSTPSTPSVLPSPFSTHSKRLAYPKCFLEICSHLD
jgi:hypothetical protein